MNLAAVIRQMTEAGAPPEAIAIAVEAIESAQSGREIELRAQNAERQRRWRERRVTLRNVTSRYSNATDPPKKERVSPTPPLQEKTTPPVSPSLRSGLVDEPVDPQPPSKKIQRLESDERLLDEVTDAWNVWAISHRCPQVKFLTKSRGMHCRQRLKDIANGEEPAVAFRKVLSKCETSFFVRGSPRSPLNFDQLMREGFLSQMLEGAFEYQGTNQWRK